MLQGLGNGFFNDQNPTIYPVGTDPHELYFGQFVPGMGQQVATLDTGSNTVSLISNLTASAPVIQSIPSGGTDPLAGVPVDLKGNGVDSLVVANNGDGNISLLSFGEGGLSLSAVATSGALPNPSGMVLSSFTGTGVDVYATTEGEQSASLVSLDLAGPPAGIPTVPGGSSGASSAPPLASLNSSSLALLGSLLTITIEAHVEGNEEGAASTAATVGAGPGAGQSLVKPFPGSDEFDDPENLVEPEQTPLSWARYVTGVDRALEKIRSQADERLLEEPRNSRGGPEGADFFEEHGFVSPAGGAPAPVREVAAPGGREGTATARAQLIDAAISAIWRDVLSSYRSALPVGWRDSRAGWTAPIRRFLEPRVVAPASGIRDGESARPLDVAITRKAAVVVLSVAAVLGQNRRIHRIRRLAGRRNRWAWPAHRS
jgi:hypothetical protein